MNCAPPYDPLSNLENTAHKDKVTFGDDPWAGSSDVMSSDRKTSWAAAVGGSQKTADRHNQKPDTHPSLSHTVVDITRHNTAPLKLPSRHPLNLRGNDEPI
jgi:hypothetical protein